MYSFSSASQICDPLPRTINGASPPTDRNARTGEFTPPGIMLSARCCRRRDCSVFRDVVDGIESSRPGEIDVNRLDECERLLYQRSTKSNSSDIHHFEIALQHATSTVSTSSCPSNREGLRGTVSGAPDCPFSFLLCESK